MSSKNKPDDCSDTEHYYVGCKCCCPLELTEYHRNKRDFALNYATASDLTRYMGKWDAVAAAQQLNGMLRGLSDVQLAQLAKAAHPDTNHIQALAAKNEREYRNENGREMLRCVPKKELDALLEQKIKDEKAAAAKNATPSPSYWCVKTAAKRHDAVVSELSDDQRDQLVAAMTKCDIWKGREKFVQELVYGKEPIFLLKHNKRYTDWRYALGAVVAVTAGLFLAMKKKAPPVKKLI